MLQRVGMGGQETLSHSVGVVSGRTWYLKKWPTHRSTEPRKSVPPDQGSNEDEPCNGIPEHQLEDPRDSPVLRVFAVSLIADHAEQVELESKANDPRGEGEMRFRHVPAAGEGQVVDIRGRNGYRRRCEYGHKRAGSPRTFGALQEI